MHQLKTINQGNGKVKVGNVDQISIWNETLTYIKRELQTKTGDL